PTWHNPRWRCQTRGPHSAARGARSRLLRLQLCEVAPDLRSALDCPKIQVRIADRSIASRVPDRMLLRQMLDKGGRHGQARTILWPTYRKQKDLFGNLPSGFGQFSELQRLPHGVRWVVFSARAFRNVQDRFEPDR